MELSTKLILFSLLCGGVAALAYHFQLPILTIVVACTYLYILYGWTRKFAAIGITE